MSKILASDFDPVVTKTSFHYLTISLFCQKKAIPIKNTRYKKARIVLKPTMTIEVL